MKIKNENKLSLKKHFVIALTIMIFFGTQLKAQQSNYSGTWTRNTEKSDVAEGLSVNSIPVELTVKQTNTQVEITRNSKNAQGESTVYTEKPDLNGSLSISIKPNLNKKGKVEWSADHRQLILTADYTDDQGKQLQKIKETWSLFNGGITLSIKAVLEANGQEYSILEVFDKKQL